MAKKPLPEFIAPMQASSAKEPFDSPHWIFETKLDGYRAIAVIDSAGKAKIWSRNRLPLESKFPMVLDAVERLKLHSTILEWRDHCAGRYGYSPVSVTATMAETPDCSGRLLPLRCTLEERL